MPRKKSQDNPVARAVYICFVIFLLLLLLWLTAHVLLLVFSGIIMAILLRTVVYPLRKYTPLSHGSALAVFLILFLFLLGMGILLISPEIVRQGELLQSALGPSLNKLEGEIRKYPLGNTLYLSLFRNGLGNLNVLTEATGVFSGILGAVTELFIVLVIGIYLAVDPGTYVLGLVSLLPMERRERAKAIVYELGKNLRGWLIGRLIVMLANGILVSIGLFILGIPLAIPLGILAMVLSFIPNIGPVLSALPALLLGFAQSPIAAVYVAIVYVIVQLIENYFITPVVDRNMVSLPPVLTLSFQLVTGILFGFLGLVLATPLAVFAFVLVRMLYVEDFLGDTGRQS